MTTMAQCFVATIKDIKKLQHNKLSCNVMLNGWQKTKHFSCKQQMKEKKVQWREKNAYLQVVAHKNHCNGHDDDLVATKIHCNAHDDNPIATKNRL